MQSKHIAIIAVVVVLLVGGIFLMNRPQTQPAPQIESPSVGMPVPGTDTTELVAENEELATGEVKEFVFDSYYAPTEGRAYFGLAEIVVNKGDTVRLKVTNTMGNHDIKIDEFNVFAATPLNQEVTVEFVADKSGEFVYYCSVPGHRASGQWGTLKVLEQ